MAGSTRCHSLRIAAARAERRFRRSRCQHDHRQLAKVLYVADRETFTGHPRAIGLATKLQQQFSRWEILHMHPRYYGINAPKRSPPQ